MDDVILVVVLVAAPTRPGAPRTLLLAHHHV
jgi:hypothetical protein